MTELITQSSDPTLWASLNSAYSARECLSHVCYGGETYKAHILTTGEVAFEEIETLDYLDSRSLTNSKKATYKELDG